MNPLRFAAVAAVCLASAFSSVPRANAIVDMKTANYAKAWTDIVVGGGGSDELKILRTYNSRSIFSGIFGFGWCSEYETALQVVGTGQIMTTECGGGVETIHSPHGYDVGAEIDGQIESIVAALRERRPDLSDDYLAELAAEMDHNSFMRREFARRLDHSWYPRIGVPYHSADRSSAITYDGRKFRRTFWDGRVEIFDEKGRMIRVEARVGEYIYVRYRNQFLHEVGNARGDSLRFEFDPQSGKVLRIDSSDGQTASYTSEGEALVAVHTHEGVTRYEYDDLHNLMEVEFPDGSTVGLTYNTDKDWVTSYRNEKGCLETYDYELGSIPQEYFRSNVKKVCGEEITNESVYEFFHKQSRRGFIHLFAAAIENNGVTTRADYDEAGRVTRRVEDDVESHYRYDPAGRIIWLRKGGKSDVGRYDGGCHHPTGLERTAIEPDGGRREWRVEIRYSATCDPVAAWTSDGVALTFAYRGGRTVDIVDEKGNAATFTYDRTVWAKPTRVRISGAGEWTVPYGRDDDVDMRRVSADWRDEKQLIAAEMLQKLTEALPGTFDP